MWWCVLYSVVYMCSSAVYVVLVAVSGISVAGLCAVFGDQDQWFMSSVVVCDCAIEWSVIVMCFTH